MKILSSRRQPGESFKKYRRRIKKESQWIKTHLKGRLIWPSKKIIHNPVTGIVSSQMLKGTFRYQEN